MLSELSRLLFDYYYLCMFFIYLYFEIIFDAAIYRCTSYCDIIALFFNLHMVSLC